MGFLAFTAIPLVLGAVYTFTDYHLLNKPHFIGAVNYRLLAQDPMPQWQLGQLLQSACV